MSYTNGFRYGKVPGINNKYAIPYKEILNPSYAASVALSPTQEETKVIFKQLTGAISITADTVKPFVGDRLILAFQADGTNRVVTLSTGFTTNSTITVVASKEATAEFMFSDKSQTWVEVSRFIQS